MLPRQPQSALTALKWICNKNRYTASVAAMLRMSLHHVSIKVPNSLSHHRTLFPRSTPMFNAQAGVVLLLRVTHTDTELPHTLTGTLLMSQTGRDITPPLGQAVSSPLSYIPKTQSVWEVWTLKGFALWGAAVSMMRKFDYVWDPTSRHTGTDLRSILHQR